MYPAEADAFVLSDSAEQRCGAVECLLRRRSTSLNLYYLSFCVGPGRLLGQGCEMTLIARIYGAVGSDDRIIFSWTQDDAQEVCNAETTTTRRV